MIAPPVAFGEVQGGEDCRVGSPDVSNAFVDRFHGVFVDVGVEVELLEILDYSETLALFRWDTEDWGVVGRS